VLWHCWLGIRKRIRPVKNELWVYLSGVRCKWLAYGPADASATPSSLASSKSTWFYLSGAGLSRSLNGCLSCEQIPLINRWGSCNSCCAENSKTNMLLDTRSVSGKTGCSNKQWLQVSANDVTWQQQQFISLQHNVRLDWADKQERCHEDGKALFQTHRSSTHLLASSTVSKVQWIDAYSGILI